MMAAEAVAVAEASEEVNTMTTPIFKPFVMVRVPLPSGYSQGEVLGLNNSNQAVGWMWNDGAEIANAFFFDPAEGVTILATDEEDMDASWAFAISDENPPTIAGVVIWKGIPDYKRAALWDGPEDEAYTPFGSGVVSAAYGVKGVSSASTLAGMYIVSSEERAVVYVEGSGASYPATGVNGEARALNESGKVVGWHMVSSASHAYSWSSNTTSDIHPSGYDASSALCVNSTGHIGGWVDDDGEILPALWTPLFFGVYTTEPFDDAGADAAVTAINSHGEMAIMRTDATPGVAIWSKRTGVDDADLLDNVTLKPGGSDVLNSAWAINDNGWIGGSYLAGGTGDPQPCLIIPYDVNNDEAPDYRQILEGKREGFTDLDTNDNWLLDWAEHIDGVGMRVGLHAPDNETVTRDIAFTQVIRKELHLRYLNYDSGNIEEYPLDAILGSQESCESFVEEQVEFWTRGGDWQREHIIWLRSSLVEGDESFDYLPESPLEVDPEELLADIREFGYRFARCIDYFKTGNEVFGGAGGYKFYDEQLDCGEQWQGAIDFENLPQACKMPAAVKVLAWLEEQAWAALEGSALAGRPLRIIGPAVTSTIVIHGYPDEQDPGFNENFEDLMRMLTPWCNENQIYFDLHDLYVSLNEAVETIEKLTGEGQTWTSPSWDQADWIVCTELGPIVDPENTWANQGNETIFFALIDPECPSLQTNWWNFTNSWRSAQFNQQGEDDWAIAAALAACAAPGGNAARAFALVCYGPTVMHRDPVPTHDMGCLRAHKVCVANMGGENPGTKYTPIKARFEDAAETYWIADFEPHPDACCACGCE